jgi:uncharacterized membrane protein YbhN (UPF0104 family)
MLRRLAASRLVRWSFVALAVSLAGVALAQYWSEARIAMQELELWTLIEALLAGAAAIGCGMLGWRRILRALGSPLPLGVGVRVYSLSQLGKYVPGSIWPFVAQVELGHEQGVPRKRSATAGLLAVGIGLVTLLLVAAITLPLASSDAAREYWWALAAVPFMLAMLHPRLLNPLLDRALRLARRAPLEHPLTLRGIVATVGWSALGALFFGLHIWLIARDIAPPGTPSPTYLAATGAYALAWSIGFLVVIAPAGAGVREVVLATALSNTLDPGQVVVLVIASRLLVTAGDLLWAGAGVLLGRRHLAEVPGEIDEALALQRAAEDSADP